MTEVSIAILIPEDLDTAEALNLRNHVGYRSVELGWPLPHSKGMSVGDLPLIADLAWTLPPGTDPAFALAVLKKEFPVHRVSVHDPQGDPR